MPTPAPLPDDPRLREAGISIVIPTYRRPDGLERTLSGCRAQGGIDVPVEIVVVDNDAAGSARALVERLPPSATMPARYVPEPIAGISRARNAGIAAARGRYIVFIDDDEDPVPGWLAAFHGVLRATGAAIAVGPVRPSFEQDAATIPPYAKRVYTRDAGLATGTSLRWSAGGNSIFDRTKAPLDRRGFDVSLRFGEDAMFLGQAVRDGCVMVWCAEAAVAETIPANKTDPAYLLRRAFGGGQVTTFFHFKMRPRETGQALRWMAIGCVQMAVYWPAGWLLRLLGRPSWLPIMAKGASGLGKVLWHPALHARLYRLARPKP